MLPLILLVLFIGLGFSLLLERHGRFLLRLFSALVAFAAFCHIEGPFEIVTHVEPRNLDRHRSVLWSEPFDHVKATM